MLEELRSWICGEAKYLDHHPGETNLPRIVLEVLVGHPPHAIRTHVIVDTGAPWCILDPEIAAEIGLISLDESPDPETRPMIIRGACWRGCIVRCSLTLLATNGLDLELDGTFFIPIESDSGDEWRHPSFIGLSGALERMRFAVDPAENVLGFGPSL